MASPRTRLAGPSEPRIKTCSTRTAAPKVPGRFLSYDWISPEEAARLRDLLTWRVPPLETVEVQNLRVKNAVHWFGLIENPTRAHDGYPNDRRTIQQMLSPSNKPSDQD